MTPKLLGQFYKRRGIFEQKNLQRYKQNHSLYLLNLTLRGNTRSNLVPYLFSETISLNTSFRQMLYSLSHVQSGKSVVVIMNFKTLPCTFVIAHYEDMLCVKDHHSMVLNLVPFVCREKAEQTIWNRLKQLTALKKKRTKTQGPLKIGLLGNVG